MSRRLLSRRVEAGIDAALEARALIDEGVEVSPLPVLPDDRN